MCPHALSLVIELPAPPDRFYGWWSRALSVSDLSVCATLHRPHLGEYLNPTHSFSLLCLSPLLRLPCCCWQNYERLQSDYVKDDHDREFSVTDLSVQIFTVPSLVSTRRVLKWGWPKTCLLLLLALFVISVNCVSHTQKWPQWGFSLIPVRFGERAQVSITNIAFISHFLLILKTPLYD